MLAWPPQFGPWAGIPRKPPELLAFLTPSLRRIYVNIRPASAADIPALAAIDARCYPDPWPAATFREALLSPWCFGLVAGAPPVGYLIGREAGGLGEILNLAVDPDQQRRGIGPLLLDAALVQLRHCDAVELDVRESNTPALSLYLEAGFLPVDRRDDNYSGGPTLVLRRTV